MPKQPLMPLPRIKAVHVISGSVREVALNSDSVYFPEHLRKDGRPNANRASDGLFKSKYYNYHAYWPYDPNREACAAIIRERIQALYNQLTEAKKELMALYTTLPTRGD